MISIHKICAKAIKSVKVYRCEPRSGLETQSFSSRDKEEVAGYAALMETIFASYEHLSLTENDIKQLHNILLKYSTKDERHRGQYKTLPNNVETFAPDGTSLGIVFETASPFDTPFQMSALVLETQEALVAELTHPLLVIGAFVVRFLAIHPFQDGNGRLSRTHDAPALALGLCLCPLRLAREHY
jgi:Fic family protein